MTRVLDIYSDIHSHDRSKALSGDTVVNILPGEPLLPGGVYSVGIHPWKSGRKISLSELKALVAASRDERVVAIGECGFDRLRGGSPESQRRLFDFHAWLAAEVGKPLIIHAVRSDDIVLAAVRRHRPEPGMWIVHGFRGKPEAAERLLRAGLSLSFGSRFNADAVAVVPPQRLYRETDSE